MRKYPIAIYLMQFFFFFYVKSQSVMFVVCKPNGKQVEIMFVIPSSPYTSWIYMYAFRFIFAVCVSENLFLFVVGHTHTLIIEIIQ